MEGWGLECFSMQTTRVAHTEGVFFLSLRAGFPGKEEAKSELQHCKACSKAPSGHARRKGRSELNEAARLTSLFTSGLCDFVFLT